MRDIKFRAWDKVEKKMIYPPQLDCEEPLLSYWINSEGSGFVVEQFTGLHDKNGKEIYEGDIVQFIHYTFGKVKGYIEFIAGAFQFYAYENSISSGILNSIACTCEIIGNIHENKEL